MSNWASNVVTMLPLQSIYSRICAVQLPCVNMSGRYDLITDVIIYVVTDTLAI